MRAKKQISLIRKAFYGIILFTVFLSTFGNGNLSPVHAQTWTSTHEITYFQGNKPGAVSITFDDSYPSQVSVGVAQLNARGLKGTFFVITGRLQLPWATWQGVATQGHEIASHTMTHPDLTTLSEDEVRWELSASQSAINQNITGQSCISFAYPYTDSNDTVQAIAADYYVAARGGYISPGRFLNHYQSGSDEYGSWYVINFFNIASMGVDSLNINNNNPDFQWFNEFLDAAVLRHAWFPLLFHDIPDATCLWGHP